MQEKTTKELLAIIRDSQSKLSMNIFNSLSDEEIDSLYDDILDAENEILSRVGREPAQ